ncbi:MAG: hypothetical protein HRU20_23545 [Pseudomonadales bacterium]|nr:hypothetical protein [Pseudomonadales bacterium]
MYENNKRCIELMPYFHELIKKGVPFSVAVQQLNSSHNANLRVVTWRIAYKNWKLGKMSNSKTSSSQILMSQEWTKKGLEGLKGLEGI